MNSSRLSRLKMATAMWQEFRSPSRLNRALEDSSRRQIEPFVPSASGSELSTLVDDLYQRGVDALLLDDQAYPMRLRSPEVAAPILLTWGNQELLKAAGVGMCGSRSVSAKGLQAARACGLEVANHDLVIISGYARGVDTETHLAALKSGGRTVIVLAEGILHFKKKKAFDTVGLDPDRVLVVSQFPPAQTWNVGAAMTRNSVIAGLGRLLVVIEAREKGGTLNAGLTALKMGRPVVALGFGDQTPEGNELLFQRGAIRINDLSELARVIETLSEYPMPTSEQLRFAIN